MNEQLFIGHHGLTCLGEITLFVILPALLSAMLLCGCWAVYKVFKKIACGGDL